MLGPLSLSFYIVYLYVKYIKSIISVFMHIFFNSYFLIWFCLFQLNAEESAIGIEIELILIIINLFFAKHFEHLLNPNYVSIALYIYKYELSCVFLMVKKSVIQHVRLKSQLGWDVVTVKETYRAKLRM